MSSHSCIDDPVPNRSWTNRNIITWLVSHISYPQNALKSEVWSNIQKLDATSPNYIYDVKIRCGPLYLNLIELVWPQVKDHINAYYYQFNHAEVECHEA